MIEAGRKFWNRIRGTTEQPINPHGNRVSDIISLAIDAYTEDFHEKTFDKMMVIGRERFGRKAVAFDIGDDGNRHPYYVYFFDVPDPSNPRRRIGFKTDHKSLTTYYAPPTGYYGQFQDDTLIDTGYLLDNLDRMCHNLEILGKLTLPDRLQPIT